MPAITIVPASTPTGTGFTLQRYYRRLADELGSYLPTSVTAQASVGEASRLAISTDLRDDEAGYDFLGNPWLYVASGTYAQQQRRIISREAGYQGSVGAVMLSRPFDTALAAGTTIEITSPLPVRRHLGVKGLTTVINEALGEIDIAATVTMTGNSTQAYDLGALGLPFVLGADQILGIRDTQWLGASEAPEYSLYGVRMVTNGVDRTLVTDTIYSTSETWYLDISIRADRLVHDGASWAYVDNDGVRGLQDDDWMAAANEDWVLAFGMANALEYLIELTDQDETLSDAVRDRRVRRLQERYDKWTIVAADWKCNAFIRPPMESPRPLAYVTGGSRRWRH